MDDKDFRLLEERIKLFSDLCTNNSTRTDERIKGIHERINKKDAKLEAWKELRKLERAKYQKGVAEEIEKLKTFTTTLIVGGSVTLFIGGLIYSFILLIK